MDEAGILFVIFGFVLAVIVLGQRHHLKTEQLKHAAKSGGFTSENSEEFRRLAERLEDRVVALEAILDDEAPGWRRKYAKERA